MEKDILRNKNARKESKKQALVESTDVPSATMRRKRRREPTAIPLTRGKSVRRHPSGRLKAKVTVVNKRNRGMMTELTQS